MFFISLTPSCLPLYHLAYVVVCSQAGIISPVQQILDLRCLEMMRLLENEATRLSLRLRDIARSSLSYLFNPYTHYLYRKSVGLSGRTLRKIPFLAHALYIQVRMRVCIVCGDHKITGCRRAAGAYNPTLPPIGSACTSRTGVHIE